MDDEDITLVNGCLDLVTLKKNEAFPLCLLGDRRPGEWVGVRDLCRQLGLATAELKADLFATWLPDPAGYEGFAVVLFYDDESKWSTTAHYNRGWLLSTASQGRPTQSGETAL